MAKKSKKARIVYKEDDPSVKAAELEAFLFGAQAPAELFERDESGSDGDDFTLQDLVNKAAAGGPADALFFEDRGGDQIDVSASEGESDDDEDVGSGNDNDASGKDSEPEADSDADSEKGSESSDDEEEKQHEERRAGLPASTSGRSGAAAAAAAAGGSKKKAAVWSDPADAELRVDLTSRNRLRKLRAHEGQKEVDGGSYEAALRKQHAALNTRTTWADKRAGAGKRAAASQADGSGDEEEEEEGLEEQLLQAGGLLAGKRTTLAPGQLEVTRVRDANQHEPCASVVRSVEFHPTGQLIMTAGLDKKLRLFQVDGVRNPKVQSVYLQDCPVHRAAFACGGAQIVATGRRPHFYVYDLQASRVERVLGPTGCKQASLESFVTAPHTAGAGSAALAAFLGDQGYLPIMSLQSRQWLFNLKMNGSVRCAAFAPDGNDLLTLGGDGVVYTWDLRTRRCRSRLQDHANVNPSSLAVSPDGRYFATGSVAGVVNLYRMSDSSTVNGGASDASEAQQHRPKGLFRGEGALTMGQPIREIDNLVTTVDSLVFSPDSQILALSSRMKKDALRLLHTPSCTVFSNWPTSRSPLHYVHSVAFSPHGGFLAAGNARGRVLLYRLHHYPEI